MNENDLRQLAEICDRGIGNIRNVKDYLLNLIPWNRLNGAFPRGIRPTDVDGEVEINCNFLKFEGKRHGQDVPKGQLFALSRYAKEANKRALIVDWDPSTQGILGFYDVLYPADRIGETWDDLYLFCQQWSACAMAEHGHVKLRKQFGNSHE